MTDPRPSPSATITIAALERDTGLSKDRLRVWERRYGFPQPLRDAHGERVYPREQVERLRLIKRLMDQGYRPGKLMGLDREQLGALVAATVGPSRAATADVESQAELDALLALIQSNEVEAARRQLAQLSLRVGLARFVIDWVAPLTTRVGEAWIRGDLGIFEEHVFTETIQGLLRGAIHNSPHPGQRPRVLFTTFPQEPHGLGVLMAEAIFSLEGASCISLGVQTPVGDIVLAARSQRADIVALSFSSLLSPAAVLDGLAELRQALPATTELWAGGSSAALQRRVPRGVRTLRTLAEIAPALAQWRSENPG